MTSTIRLANIADLKQLQILFENYLEFYHSEVVSKRCEAFLRDRLQKEDSVVFVAENDKKELVGFVQLYPIFSSLNQKRSWVLNDLFVEDKSRGQGIAKLLVKRAEHFSKESGAKGLSLQTSVENASAQALYTKLGWIKDQKYLTFYFNH